jgi:uncharacterized membrane protein YfcA
VPGLFDNIIIFLLGSLGGFLSGYLGVGGGIVFVPILTYYLQKLGLHDEALVKAILANSLFTIIFSGLVASYKQYRMGNFHPREIIITALPGMITALLCTWLIKSGSWYSKSMFDYVFGVMLLLILLKMLLTKSKSLRIDQRISNWKYQVIGFFAGIITAMSGLGGGVVMTPVFTDVLGLDIKKASSVSNGVIPMFAITMGIYNLWAQPNIRVSEWQVGYIILPLVLPLIIAALAFAPIGVRVSQNSKASTIRVVFGVFVTIVFVNLMYALFKA